MKIFNSFGLQTTIAPYERAFRFQNGAVDTVLNPGVHWNVPFLSSDIMLFDISDAECIYPHMDTLLATQPNLVKEHFVVADLSDTEAALVYQDGKLTDILAPGSRAYYWKGVIDVRIEIVNLLTNLRVDESVARLIGRTGKLAIRAGALKAVLGVDVQERQTGLLYESGVLLEVLTPGYHMFWNFNRKLTAKVTDSRWVLVDVAGQEIICLPLTR